MTQMIRAAVRVEGFPENTFTIGTDDYLQAGLNWLIAVDESQIPDIH